MTDVIDKLKELLDVENIKLDSKLDVFDEWDSLSMIALISHIKKYHQININLDELIKCTDIQDILNLLSDTNGGGGIRKNPSFILLSFPSLYIPLTLQAA